MARTKGKSLRSAIRSALPAGYRDASGGNFPDAWNPGIGDALQGTVTAKREVTATELKRENAKKGEKVIVLTVADEDGVLHTVFESAGLRQLCRDAKVGSEVFMRLDSVKKFGKKRFKSFTAGIKGKK